MITAGCWRLLCIARRMHAIERGCKASKGLAGARLTCMADFLFAGCLAPSWPLPNTST